MTKRNRTHAMIAASAAFVLALLAAVLLSAWSTWSQAKQELRTVVLAVDERSIQVRMESLLLSSKLPDTEDCNRTQLRALIANTHYVRDIGRLRGTTIYCNAEDGAGARIELGPPTTTRSDGVRMWITARGMWAARGHSFLRMDPMSFVDMQIPETITVAMLEGESGRLLVHSAHLPKSLFEAGAKLRQGELHQQGYVAAVSHSSDGRTIDMAVRSLDSIKAAYFATLPRTITLGAVAGVLLFALVMFAFVRHYSLMSELRRALHRCQLGAALQPIVDTTSGGAHVVGFECLARWTRLDGSSVSPSLFVPMVEAAGLGSALARCIVSSLVASFGATLRENPTLYVALNLSSADVADPRLLDDIDRVLTTAGIPTSQIVIELTERTFEAEGLAGGLERLRQAGHRLSIDDFGTGASNASRLASFRPEMVKVDRSFLLHADTDSHAAELLPQLVAMARDAGARVVIEGIETTAQAQFLAGYDDVFAQGYFWHRPMPAAEAARLVAAQRAGVLAAVP
ncbi:MAG: EAL domain-containing protein, partial [Arenimonas sp.]